MAYTTPTAAQFKARFPAFSAVADETVDAFIAEANRNVDTSWLEADYQRAIMYLAAHLMTIEDVLGEAPDGFKFSGGVITSEKLGDAQTNYGNTANASAAYPGDYGATVYGRQFATLLKLNQPAVLVV